MADVIVQVLNDVCLSVAGHVFDDAQLRTLPPRSPTGVGVAGASSSAGVHKATKQDAEATARYLEHVVRSLLALAEVRSALVCRFCFALLVRPHRILPLCV